MHKDYTYRQGTMTDVKELANLALLSYGQYKNKLSEEHWETMSANLSNENSHLELLKISTCFVCAHNDKIIGMAYLIPKGNPTIFFEESWAYIRLLGVDPAYGGKGIGKQLTRLCIGFASDKGEKTLALHTSGFQDAARHIYESMGFKQVRELAPVHGKRYWLYTMAL